MDLPDVSGLPVPAQIVFIACVAVVYGLIHFGVVRGRKAPADKRPDANEIVAITVDSRAIDRLTGEVSGLTFVLHKLTEQLDGYFEEKRKERADRDLDEEVRNRVASEVKKAIEEANQPPKPRSPRG